MLRFNFDAQAGETPASIAQKRALVAQIMGAARTPTTFGEGLSALGDGIVANVLGGRAADAERAGQASADDTFSQLVASITGQGAPTPSYGPATASDATAAMAGGDFLSGLVNSESGGNWNALNDEGYGGRLQFGDARLADAAAAGLVPAGTTGAMFSQMSPEQQQAVEAWHFGDIDRQATAMGLNQYFGQTIGGVPINAESVRAMSHLGGVGGAQRFIESGGQYNPADSNGTRLSDYGTRFGGGAGAPAQVAQGPGLAALMEAASNPWLSDSQKAVINSMLEQEMQAMDPMRQLQMQAAQQGIEKGAIELDALRNPVLTPPDPTSAMQNYEYLVGQGVEPTVAQDMAFGGGGVTVNNNASEVGTIPAGWELVTDPTTGARSMQPIPGGPAAAEAEDENAAASASAAQSGTTANIVREDIGRIRDIVTNAPWFNPAVGFGSGLLQQLEGTNATNVAALSETVRANIGFDRLQAMREASPTGGALGNVTERELSNLQAVMGNLSQSQSVEQFLYNLDRLGEVYDGIIAKAAAYPNAAQFGFGGVSPSPDAAPLGIDALLEKYQ